MQKDDQDQGAGVVGHVQSAREATAAELRAIAAFIRVPGNIWIEDPIDQCARVLEHRAAYLLSRAVLETEPPPLSDSERVGTERSAKEKSLSDLSSIDVEQARQRVITQAFVSGQMNAQLKYADDLTRPTLKLLQAKAYALAQESLNDLLAAVVAQSRLDQLLPIAALVNAYHNEGTALSAAETIRAIADRLGPPMEAQSRRQNDDAGAALLRVDPSTAVQTETLPNRAGTEPRLTAAETVARLRELRKQMLVSAFRRPLYMDPQAIDSAIALLDPAIVAIKWRDIATAPQDGSAFRAYSPSLIHADFNPWGSVEACFDGERFIGAEWDGQHDIWNTVFLDGRATHWMPLPEPPTVVGSGNHASPEQADPPHRSAAQKENSTLVPQSRHQETP